MLEGAADQAVRQLRKHDQVIRGLYRKRTGASDEDLDALMRLEEWLVADEALAWGFIDAVFEPSAEEEDAAEAAVAYAPAPSVLAVLGLPRLPRKGHQPLAGENFAA